MEEDSAAYTLGYNVGRTAGAWVFDGNTTRATYAYVLKGIDEGDPEIYDAYNTPDLSGEWAGGETPHSLAHKLGLTASDELDTACDEWEAGVRDGFWHEVERVARYQLED